MKDVDTTLGYPGDDRDVLQLTRCLDVQIRYPTPTDLIATMLDVVCGALLTASRRARRRSAPQTI